MLKNIHAPLSGAIASERVLEIIANNLANVNTVGFKEESVSFKLLSPRPEKQYRDPIPPANYKIDLEKILPLRGNEFSYVGVSGVSRNQTQGPAIITENPFDLTIAGRGYFSVLTSEGDRYTRNGALSLSNEGVLVNKFGDPLLGEKGTIRLAVDKNFEVNSFGEIYQDDHLVDKIQIYNFKNPLQLEQIGHNNYFYKGDSEDISKNSYPEIAQGMLEGSNVNAIKNLTNMIIAHRSYEAYQKSLSDFDKMMEKSNTIGQV